MVAVKYHQNRAAKFSKAARTFSEDGQTKINLQNQSEKIYAKARCSFRINQNKHDLYLLLVEELILFHGSVGRSQRTHINNLIMIGEQIKCKLDQKTFGP